MSVYNAMRTAIYSKLSADGTLISALGGTVIYFAQAPDSASPPFVVFNFQGGGPLNINANDLRDQIVFVRGFADNPTKVGDIDAACSDLLHRSSIDVSGYTNFWLAREQDLSLVENLPNNVKRYMAGALYRVRIA